MPDNTDSAGGSLSILVRRITIIGLTVLVCLLSSLPKARAGVVIGGTRIVMSEKSGTVTFSVRNRDAVPYLISTKIKPATAWEGGLKPEVQQIPFIVTPPLFSLGANRENTIRIQRAGGDLPQDRESLFQLEVATIPPGKPTDSELQVAFRSRLKLLWRPLGLKGNSGDAYKQLQWQHSGEDTIVNNPTPFVVTLLSLKVNGRTTNSAGVVLPFSSRRTHWCPVEGSCQIEWQSIDDYGRTMPLVRAVVAKQ